MTCEHHETDEAEGADDCESCEANASIAELEAKIEQKAIDAKQHAMAVRYEYLAVILGYNELCKKAPTLGEKVYCRAHRENARKKYEALGGQIEYKDDNDFLLVLGSEDRLWIRFKEDDIEQMRECVSKWDEDHPK